MALAGRAYAELAGKAPENLAYALAVRGHGLMDQLKYEQAFGAFRKVLSKNPDFVGALASPNSPGRQ